MWWHTPFLYVSQEIVSFFFLSQTFLFSFLFFTQEVSFFLLFFISGSFRVIKMHTFGRWLYKFEFDHHIIQSSHCLIISDHTGIFNSILLTLYFSMKKSFFSAHEFTFTNICVHADSHRISYYFMNLNFQAYFIGWGVYDPPPPLLSRVE